MLVLPLLPVMAITFSGSDCSVVRGQRLIASERVGNTDQGESFRRRAFPTLLDHRADRAALAGLLDELVPVEIFAAQRHEEIARLQRSRIGADPRNRCLRRRRPRASRRANLAIWRSESGSMIQNSSGRFSRALPRHLDVVERHGVIGEFLVGFVAFAGDQNDVARLRQLDGARDRFRAIGNFLVVIRAKTLFDFGDDRVGIFFPRIVRSDDAVIGILIDHAAHERALLPVAIAAATENDDETPRRKFAQRLEDIEQRIVRVRVIDKDLELPLRRNCFEAARAPGEIATGSESLRAS